MSFSKEVYELYKINTYNAPGDMLSVLSPHGAPSGRRKEAVDSLILKTMFLCGKQKKAQFQAPQKKSFKALQEEVGKLLPH